MINIYNLDEKIKPISLDLLVLNFNKFEEYGKNCILSIINQDLDQNTKIFILDNDSTDGSKEKIKEFVTHYPQITFYQSDENLGFAGGMNFLAKHSKGDWMLLINNDTYFPDQSIKELKNILERAKDNIAAIGPITNAAGNEQNININGTLEEIVSKGEKLVSEKLNLLFDVPRLDFFCVAIKRTLWNQLEGLDEIYEKGYYEDFDFCVRLKNFGYRMAITEDVFIYHKGSASFSANKQQKIIIKKNKKIFQSKFPMQKLYHVRENNFEMLKNYTKLENESSIYKKLLETRKNIRINFLKSNIPKSLLKKIRWYIKIKKYKLFLNEY